MQCLYRLGPKIVVAGIGNLHTHELAYRQILASWNQDQTIDFGSISGRAGHCGAFVINRVHQNSHLAADL